MSEIVARLAAALADRYRIERELGQGGMATVYLARDLKHDREVALKVLRPDLAAALGRERFLNEIRLTARLEHPHILTLIDSGEWDGFLWYALPFVRGESLRDRLRREGQLSLPDTLTITRQVAAALDYAHARGVIHRDLKPENILLHEGEAMLADFGIALALREAGGSRLTGTGVSLGTPHYMSPEQAAGDRTLDARSDVYALGAVVYEMLAGEPPHTGATAQAVVAKLMTERPTALRVVRSTVSSEVESAVSRALAKVPADRFATAGEFAAAMVRPETAAPSRPRRGAVGLVAGISIVVLAALFGWRRVPSSDTPTGPIRLAVLPFESVGDSGDRTFGDGMSEAILDRLGRLPKLSLMGRASVLRYPSSGQTPLEFARGLGVGYVLNGTVRWASGPGGAREVRISPELIRVSDGTRVWGEPYEGPLANVFALQGSVAEQVATALRVRLGVVEQTRVRGAPTADVEAYRSYLLGRQVLNTRWWAGAEAARYFESAIAHDSAFAGAYAGLAVARSLAWDFGDRSLPRDSVYARARRAAQRALALDSTLSEGHTALGRVLDAGDWNWQAADTEFRRALALDSNDASARQWYVMHLLGLGRTAEAVAEARTAVRFDPLTPLTINALGLALWFDGRVDSAVQVFRRSLEWDSTGSVVGNLMGVYMVEGRPRDAEELARRWPRRVTHDVPVLIARARAGEPVKREALKALRAEFAERDDVDLREPSYAILAGNFAMLGERDSALTALERAEAAHEERLIVAIEAWPPLVPLHADPRYQAILRRMGLPQ